MDFWLLYETERNVNFSSNDFLFLVMLGSVFSFILDSKKKLTFKIVNESSAVALQNIKRAIVRR